MQLPTIHRFSLVKDLKSYQKATSLWKEGGIPLISPFESVRLARWMDVLTWYGSFTTEDTRAMGQCLPNEGDFVIAIDGDFSAPAKFYAEASNRPFLFIQEKEIEQVVDIVIDRACRSLFFVGTSEHFSVGRIRELGRRISVPWGFVTAQDLPGITFVIAKLLAGVSGTNGDWGVIDLVAGTERQVDSNGQLSIPTIMDGDRIRLLVAERNWHTLALRAHGESTHVNLNSVVLCGLINEREHGITGELIDGCRTDDKVRSCKRVHSKDIHILSFGDLKAQHLFLYSCFSFAVDHGLYPSDLTTIHSIAEGYPRMAVITDRVLGTHPLDPVIILDLCRQQVGLGEAVKFENDLVLRRAGNRPYVLFGDPCGPEPHWITLDATREVRPTSGCAVLPVWLDKWSEAEIVGLDTRDPETCLMIGRRTAAIIQPRSGIETSVRIVDKTDIWDSYMQWFKGVGRRAQRAASIERAIPRVYQSEISSSPEFQEALHCLSDVRIGLQEGVQEALQICELVRRRGVWIHSLDLWMELCPLKVNLWDHQFGTLMLNHLFSGNFHGALIHGFAAAVESEGPGCDYCGSPLTTLRMSDLLEYQPDQYMVECPSCGEQEVWWDGGVRLQVDLSSPLRPSSTNEITLRFSTPQILPLQGILDGILVAELIDKGSNKVLFRFQERINSNPYTLAIEVPAETTSELHTLRLAWVHGLYVTYLRRRWPSYRFLI